MATDFDSVAVTRSYEQIVQQIQDRIHRGTLSRGQKLPTERQLSDTFGVSRGVVREAVKVLSAMGLIEARQGSGIYVRNPPRPYVSRAFTLSVSPEETSLARLFELRGALESFAAGCAAERRTDQQAEEIHKAADETVEGAAIGDVHRFKRGDDQFHAAVYNAASNPYLAVAANTIREMQGDVVRFFADMPGSISIAAQHHIQIARAIALSDPEASVAAMEEHITYTAGMVAETLHGIGDDEMTKGGESTPLQ